MTILIYLFIEKTTLAQESTQELGKITLAREVVESGVGGKERRGMGRAGALRWVGMRDKGFGSLGWAGSVA
jgi:hypothetical protein